jgi:hypothetical protein
MSSFYGYNLGSTHGPFLQKAINASIEADRDEDDALALLTEVRAIMVQMLDGDGSQEAHYATIQARFGFDSVAAAHAAFLEIDSAWGNSMNNDSRAAVKAARTQLFARITV